MKLIRMIAEGQDIEDCKIIMHLTTEEGRILSQEQLGYQEEEGSLYPFILFPPESANQSMQKMELGEYCETETTTNLFAKAIAVGEYFTLIEDGDEYTYKITHVTEIC